MQIIGCRLQRVPQVCKSNRVVGINKKQGIEVIIIIIIIIITTFIMRTYPPQEMLKAPNKVSTLNENNLT